MDGEHVLIFLVGLWVGFIICLFVAIVPQDILISQDTADDVCRQITGNETAIAKEDRSKVYGGKLFCIIPSFDDTQNIVIKSNKEEKQ